VTLCVLAASVALSWSFEDETSPYAEEINEALKSRSAVVPMIWPLEVDNAILTAIRRRRIQEADAFRLLPVLDTLPLEIGLEAAREALGQRILGDGPDSWFVSLRRKLPGTGDASRPAAGDLGRSTRPSRNGGRGRHPATRPVNDSPALSHVPVGQPGARRHLHAGYAQSPVDRHPDQRHRPELAHAPGRRTGADRGHDSRRFSERYGRGERSRGWSVGDFTQQPRD
jgi:hypothetical protein